MSHHTTATELKRWKGPYHEKDESGGAPRSSSSTLKNEEENEEDDVCRRAHMCVCMHARERERERERERAERERERGGEGDSCTHYLKIGSTSAAMRMLLCSWSMTSSVPDFWYQLSSH